MQPTLAATPEFYLGPLDDPFTLIVTAVVVGFAAIYTAIYVFRAVIRDRRNAADTSSAAGPGSTTIGPRNGKEDS